LLQAVKQYYPQIDVVMTPDAGRVLLALQAISVGAFDYVPKPVKVEDLRNLLERLGRKQALDVESVQLRREVETHQRFGELVGACEKMQKIYHLILRVAPKRHPVLILGESGTGKELVARAIHQRGPWRDQPFVPVDCGALTPTLIESELFGHVRGAFTGATQNRLGLLASAEQGTVFLDEIAELPVELQAKLLRALQEREIRPIGTNEAVRIEARIIAATNLDAQEAIKAGTLRKDLYYRLNVVSIKLPALRERKGDIPALAHHFLERYRGAAEGIVGFSPEVMNRLLSYDWPGNVRELENCVQRALAVASPPLIQVKDLPSNLLYHVPDAKKAERFSTLRDMERRAILQALEATGGDRLRAAKLLGISKTTIYRKLKEYGVEGIPGAGRSA